MAAFSEQLAFGRHGESYIARWLKRQGYSVLPVYEKQIDTGKGPVWFTPDGGKLIAPDILCMKRGDQVDATRVKGHVRWIEAKTKSAFSWYRVGQRWVTGIDLRHYEDYLRVNELSFWPVWLVFLHLEGTAKDTPSGMVSPTGLFGNTLRYLSQHESHRSNRHGRSGMVYWAHSTLQQIATLEDVLACAPNDA